MKNIISREKKQFRKAREATRIEEARKEASSTQTVGVSVLLGLVGLAVFIWLRRRDSQSIAEQEAGGGTRREGSGGSSRTPRGGGVTRTSWRA